MAGSQILDNFRQGNPPRGIRLAAARGLMPIAPSEMLTLLILLTRDADPEVSAAAATSLGGRPETEIIELVQSPECPAEVLEFFAASPSAAVQEAVILNQAASGELIRRLAGHVGPQLLEVILYNRTRLIESPEILASIRLNPAATAQILGVVHEIETEFFGDKRQDYVVDAGEDETVPDVVATAAPELELPPDDLSLEGLPLDPQEREAVLSSRINTLSVRQKIKLAMMGTREMRSVLIRDTNKEVSRTVLQSPKLTQNEVESFSAMRNLSDEVLRIIAVHKEWTRSYTVIQNLVKNPKTPPMMAQRFLFRLQQRDLMLLTRDRSISEAVRRGAVSVLNQRKSGKSAS